jgi:hypothetical protein
MTAPTPISHGRRSVLLLSVAVVAALLVGIAGLLLALRQGHQDLSAQQDRTGAVSAQLGSTAGQAKTLAQQIQDSCDRKELAGPVCDKAASVAANPVVTPPSSGRDGSNGALGPIGATGRTGDAGASIIGPPGIAGASGPAGIPGPTGALGPAGQSIVGITGSTGADGSPGASITGPTGAAGPAGIPGAPGEPGAPGAPGAPAPTPVAMTFAIPSGAVYRCPRIAGTDTDPVYGSCALLVAPPPTTTPTPTPGAHP